MDFENTRGTRAKPGEINSDVVILEQLLKVKNDLTQRVDELTRYTLEIGGFYPLTIQLIPGENIPSNNFCYLKSDGKMWRANATDDTKSTTLLAVSAQEMVTNVLGRFYLYGRINKSGLTGSAIYYLDILSGYSTTTPPSASGNIVRVVGYALSTEIFFFNPDPTWVKIR
jgi:hypothetical protein